MYSLSHRSRHKLVGALIMEEAFLLKGYLKGFQKKSLTTDRRNLLYPISFVSLTQATRYCDPNRI